MNTTPEQNERRETLRRDLEYFGVPIGESRLDSSALFTADFAYGIAQRVASKLFKNRFDEKGRRLVITTEDGKDLGGWCKGAVIDRIADEILAVNVIAESHQTKNDHE